MRRKKPRSLAFRTWLRVTCTCTHTCKLVGRAHLGKERTGRGIQPPLLPHDLRSVSRAHGPALSFFPRSSHALPCPVSPLASADVILLACGLSANWSCLFFLLLFSKQCVLYLLLIMSHFRTFLWPSNATSPRPFVRRALQNWQPSLRGFRLVRGEPCVQLLSG